MTPPDPRPTALIVDDEPPARARLRDLIEADGRLRIIGEAGDGRSAVREIERQDPSVVLLDVQMPELDGFEVLEALEHASPRVIFVTAYDEFAVRAFEVRALDYLLKPTDAPRLQAAIDRALERTGTEASAFAAARPLKRFLVRRGDRITLVPCDDVDWIGAADNYVELHAGGRRHLLRGTLQALEARLDPDRFVRVHRSAIVNLEAVERFTPLSHGDWTIHMRDGAEVRLSRRYRAALASRVEL